MPELILGPFIIALIILPHIIAYKLAKHLGRDPKFWFWISFILPVIAIIILIFLPELKEEEYGQKTDSKV